MTLQEIVTAILTTAVPGSLAWAIVRQWFSAQPGERKPWIAFAFAAGLTVLAYLVQVAMLYAPAPADWRGWVEAIVPLIGWAYTCSQGVYLAAKAIEAHRAPAVG